MYLVDSGKESVLRGIVCEFDSDGENRVMEARALNKRAHQKYNYLSAPISTNLKLSQIDSTEIVNLKAYYSTWFAINKSQPLGLLIGMKLSKEEIPTIYKSLIEYAKNLCS